jgi:hypothetical protein
VNDLSAIDTAMIAEKFLFLEAPRKISLLHNNGQSEMTLSQPIFSLMISSNFAKYLPLKLITGLVVND